MITGTGRHARIRIPGQKNPFKFFLYRPLRGTPKRVTIHRDATGCFTVQMACELGDVSTKMAPEAIPTDRKVGIDLGLISLIATSNGETVPNPKHFQKSQEKLAAQQRRVEKESQKGSNGRRNKRRLVAKTNKKIKNQRRDFMFKLAKLVVAANHLIVIEKLNIKGLAQSGLAKYVNYVGWRILIQTIKCKAEEAGVLVVEVDPRYTSQECCGCGDIKRKDLRQRWHHCTLCGMSLDRDVNAARVILARGVAALGTSVEQAPGACSPVKARRSKRNGGDHAVTQL